MTGDKNPPEQWPPHITPQQNPAERTADSAATADPTAKRKPRTEGAAAPAPKAARAQPRTLSTPEPQLASAPAGKLPDFGNGNIFGEAFASLLDQVESAKQHERELEERAAQEALARTLAEKGVIPAPNASTSFAAQAQAFAQARQEASQQPATQVQAAAQPPAATPTPAAAYTQAEYQTGSYQADPYQANSGQPTSRGSAQQPAYRAPSPVGDILPAEPEVIQATARPTAAPLVSDINYTSQPATNTPPAYPQPASEYVPADNFVVPTNVQHLRTRFDASGPFLARFLPEVASSQTGIQAGFCNLHDFLGFLHEQNWYGYLHAVLGDQSAYVLVYEGRTVAAACQSSTGEQALGEMLHLYEQGARLNAYPLEQHLAHILSGVGARAWKFNLTEDFTGLHAKPDEAAFYYQGRVVATMPAGLPYEGAFPAPLRPQTLILPRSLAGWAHHSYVATLRGRDAVNAITPAHLAFKAKFGNTGLNLQAALLEGITPAEYALRHDIPLHELEPTVHELVSLGYLKDE